MATRPSKMVTFNVSGELFTVPEADILKYPYSKLADVSSFTLSDDIASLNVPTDAFRVITHYLSTNNLPQIPLPSNLKPTFKILGIPYPSALTIDHHTASIGASGTLREWEARLSPSSDAGPSATERRGALREIQAGLLTGCTEPPSPPASVEAFSELPAYSDIHPTLGPVASKDTLIPAIIQSLDPQGMSYVILIPSDERSLAAIERPSWDTGAGAADEEEVLSFASTPREKKKVLRFSTGSEYTWDHISQSEFLSTVQENLKEALYHRRKMSEKGGVVYGTLDAAVSIWVEQELVLKNISSMGLYETRRGRAVVIQVCK